MPPDLVRLSVVAARTSFTSTAREDNLRHAWSTAREAASAGADLVVFPESFPGDWRAPVTWTPEVELSTIAKELGIHVIGGFTEPLDAEGVRCFNTLALFGPDGREVGRYRRTTPAHDPWIYKDGPYWDFQWVKSDELPVFQTDIGRLGLLMCNEVFAPELARALAIQGADLVLLPAGLAGPHVSSFEAWRTLIWARAIENLVYTSVSSNVPVVEGLDEEGRGERAMVMICSPEGMLLEDDRPGVHTADLDLTRLRTLREEQHRRKRPDEPRLPWATVPGNLRDWRRDAVLQANPVLLTGSPDPVPPASSSSEET